MLMLESEQRRRRKHRSGSTRSLGVSRDLSPLTLPNGFGEHSQKTDEGQVKQEEVEVEQVGYFQSTGMCLSALFVGYYAEGHIPVS